MALDRLDKMVLAELDRNARANNSEIARKLRINKGVVAYRIKNLEKDGIIRGYYAIIDTFKLGYLSYRLYLKLQYSSPAKQKEIMGYLIGSNSVWWAGLIGGRFNIAALLWARDQNEIVRFWNEFNAKFRANIADSRISLYHGLEHYPLPFAKQISGRKSKPESIGLGTIAKIDQTDAKLLKIISGNARMPLLEIAKLMNLTPAAVRYRMKQLLKKRVIVAYRAIVAMDKLGYSLYKVDFNLKDMSAYPQMLEFARQSPNVFYVDKSIGWADFEIEVYAQTTAEFYSFLEGFRTKFADSIRDYDFFAYSKITKLLYVPEDLSGN